MPQTPWGAKLSEARRKIHDVGSSGVTSNGERVDVEQFSSNSFLDILMNWFLVMFVFMTVLITASLNLFAF